MKSGLIEHKLKTMASGLAGRLAGAQRRILFVVLMLAALAVVRLNWALLPSAHAQSGGTWATKADMPTARGGLAAATIDGKLYAVGGHPDAFNSLSTLEVYNPATDSWETKADMPTPRYGFGMAALDGKLYAVAGFGGDAVKLEVYDPATDSWEIKANLPTQTFQLAAAAIGGKLYAVGGVWNGNFHSLSVYDPAADTWEPKAPMPTARYSLAAAAIDGKLYAVGGYNSSALNTLEVYDPATDTWETKAGMPTARGGLAAAAIDGRLYVVGAYNKLEVYDPATDTWTTEADLPTWRSELAAAAIDGKLYAVGGVNGDRLKTLEVFSPGSFCQPITISPAAGPLPAGTVGTSYSQQFTQVGGIGTISWMTVGDTSGLTIDSNGLLSGTPIFAGTFNFAVMAQDENDCPGSAQFTLEIARGDQTITFDPIQDRIFGDEPFELSVETSSHLRPMFSASGTCTVSDKTVTLTGEGSCTITASQAGDDNYNPALPVSQSFTIGPASNCPQISLSPAKLPAGTIGVSYSVKLTPVGGAGPYQITVGQLPDWMSAKITNSSVTISGQPTVADSFTVVIKVRDRNDCTNARSNRLSLEIVKPTPEIVWNNPADIHCNTPLGPAQLNATANVAGTFTYSPPAGTILGFGQHLLSVNFTPNDTANWDSASRNVQINVVPYPYITLKPGVSIDSNDHLYRTFRIEDMVAGVTDGCASLSINNAVIEKVTSDEADNIAGNTDGDTTNDIVILPNCKSVQLRAERDDRGDGRVYNVTLRVTAGEGIGTRAVFQVQVPVRSGKPAVNGAVIVTKLSNCQP